MRKIIKFEKSDCNPCTMVSELLDKTGIQYEKVNNLKVPYKIVERRSGDIAMCYSSPKKAKEELGFSCKKTLILFINKL